ncbi:MAG: hypothetical protein J7L75_05110 [Thermoproteales archaeon]|nr:hypothetical protein [Thermoproteales archaeon]
MIGAPTPHFLGSVRMAVAASWLGTPLSRQLVDLTKLLALALLYSLMGSAASKYAIGYVELREEA